MPIDLIVSPPPRVELVVTQLPRIQISVVALGTGGGGSGTLTSVDTGSPAIVVTDPTGPDVGVALNEAELESGGAQELDLTGMSGTLADPQTPAAHASTHANGQPDEINVAGLNGELADPQPPKTHASSHQNGNADEISVAGLSGTLADAQRANVIVETTGPTDLAAGAIADGQYLRRSGSTYIGDTPSSSIVTPSEFWARPAAAVAHAKDAEFDSSTLPSAFKLYNIQSGVAVLTAPISGVDVFTQPAAGNVRIEANKNGRRSWLLLQPRGENVRWIYAQPITLSGNNGWVLRSRFATHIKLLSGTNNAAVMRFLVCKDTGGVPHTVVGPGIQAGIVCGWESDANTMAIEYATAAGGVVTSITTGADVDNLQTVDFEIVYVLRAGAASVTWDIWFKSATVTQHVTTFVATGLSVGQGDTVHVGWDFVGVDANMPSAPILSADYARHEDSAAGFIP